MLSYSNLNFDSLPTTRPRAIMWELVAGSRAQLVFAVVLRSLLEIAAALTPVVLGIGLDAGLEHGATRGVWIAAGWLALLALLQAAGMGVGHGAEVLIWVRSAIRSMGQLHTHVTRTGTAVTREKSTGEVVATTVSDSEHVGNLLETVPRVTGGIIAFFVVAVILLGQHPVLGLVVLIGVPLITAAVTLLVKPLQERQSLQREEQGKLTSLGTDTVAGLRVLRGIGGEHQFTNRYREQSQRVRQAGNKVATLQSWIDGLQILIPGLFTAFVMWAGANLALNGELSVGQFAALFGLTTYLARPLQMVMMSITQFGRARVGARKIFNILRIAPISGTEDERAQATSRETAGKDPITHPELDELFAGPIVDRTSGIDFRPGLHTAIVSAKPDESVEILRRLARIDDSVSDVTASGVDIRQLPLLDVRRNIVYSPATPELFGGPLRSVIDASTTYPIDDRAIAAARERALGPQEPIRADIEPLRDQEILTALEDADGMDVLSSLESGLDGEITEKARSLSGGQRQRVALARSILLDPQVLLLVEPTSAVDSHTEDRIVRRLRERRAGRTTILTSASPLILDKLDEIVFLVGGKQVARGTHADLLARADAGEEGAKAYVRVISRSTGGDEK